MTAPLKLISHKLCPYVQRAVIALTEKGVPFQRIDIDLANKPDWFRKISPLGKTPVLVVGDHAIFESAVILEYLEETQANPLHPADALARAEHRSWIEFGSAVLNDIAGLYSAPDETAFRTRAVQLEARFARLGSARCFVTSTRSMRSVISAFSRANRSWRAGVPRSRRDRRSNRPLARTIRRCCATSSIGNVRTSRNFRRSWRRSAGVNGRWRAACRDKP
jgi:glutaredoxin